MANIQKEIECYGETVEQMRSAVIFTNLKDPKSVLMYAMSILSDAQMVMELANHDNRLEAAEKNRQYINKAKYFISEAQKLV